MIAPSPFRLLTPWRAQGFATADTHNGTSPFDEVVVGDLLHVEAMGASTVWMRVGPLRFWVRKHGERAKIKVHRESADRRFDVKVEGDLEQDQAWGDDLAHRTLLAYEVARGWNKAAAPDAVRLTRAVQSVVGPLLQERSRRDR